MWSVTLVSKRGWRKKVRPSDQSRKSFQRRKPRGEKKQMSFNQQTPPTIILLKGDTSQGRGQLISNINACLAIQDTVRTTVTSPPILTNFSLTFLAGPPRSRQINGRLERFPYSPLSRADFG